MTKSITEDEIEQFCLNILKSEGYKILFGPNIAPDGEFPERESYSQVVLKERLQDAIDKINPNIPKEAREEALTKAIRPISQDLLQNNHHFHKFLIEGVPVEYKKEDGSTKSDYVKLVDFEKTTKNQFLAVNQFTVIEDDYNRRPDIVIFLNGIPIAVIELKNLADEKATIEAAYNQIQTYKRQISSLFSFNEILVISDGISARAGTISASREWFLPWKRVRGKKNIPGAPEIHTLIEGIFTKPNLLDIIKNFIVFDKEGENAIKKIAAYHQFHAANKAIVSTLDATNNSHKVGVVWHTQGSGKSLTMAFYSGKLISKLNNPTIVVLTDRNDLDDQLFKTFTRCRELLRQTPKQVESRSRLASYLKVPSGGVVFTTIQKFMPEKGSKYPVLSKRSNIIVIVDEAHRSQYGFSAKYQQKEEELLVKYGFAKYLRDALPNASFIGFTGTPIEKTDKNTKAVFGDYIDIYDIEQAVKDEATVKIYYESRLAKLELKPEERPKIDPDFEEVTEQEESDYKEKLKSKWSRLEKLVGSQRRIKRIAKDIVKHFEARTQSLEGKGLIVCMSRRICVDLHDEIVKLRPDWYNKDDSKGFLKVVMTGSSSDKENWQEHIRNKKKRDELGDRFKDSQSELKLVIVRDMWLTGFDVPSLHTIYIDKPMRGHNLMQAIARVNRVYKNKPGGLIVDYLGIAEDLKNALQNYSVKDREETGIPVEKALAYLTEKYEVVSNMFHGFDYKKFFSLSSKDKMPFILKAMDFVLREKGKKERFIREVTALSSGYSLVNAHEEAAKLRDEIAFFQAIKATLVKTTLVRNYERSDVDSAIRQIVSKAVVSDRVIDIFEAAGIKKPDISILSDEFLASVKDLPEKNVAFETLKKLLNDEIHIRMKKNKVEAKSFADLLEKAIKRYQNKSIEAAQVIDELINIANQIKVSDKRGESIGLSDDEIAFYDALAENKNALEVLGDKKLRQIAKELVSTVRNNTSVDWTLRESVRAKIRVLVKRTLRKYGYPPDKQKKATDTVLEQAKNFSSSWAEMVE